MARNVYLAPGFFGFDSLGGVNYFHRVAGALREALDRRGFEANIVECATQPTGSIRRRATKVLDQVIDSGGLEADEVHFVGHSTGGLDIRLAVTPGVRLRPGRGDDEEIASRTRSVISLATPHYGTPLANYLTTVSGRHILELLTLAATTTGGRYAVFAAARALKIAARVDDWVGRDQTFLDQWVDRILDRVTLERDDPIWGFMREVSEDQGAIIQLTPESMNLFNAAVTDREGVRYGSIVTAAPPAPRNYRMRELLAPTTAALAAAFTALYHLTAREHRHYPYPDPGVDILGELGGKLPFSISSATNDGVVPSMSQVYGRVLDTVVADHLDVVGQYETGEPHSDWLPSASRYGDDAFQGTWDTVAEEIVAASREGAGTSSTGLTAS